MPTILPMAVITVAASFGLWGGFLWLFSGRDGWYFRLVAVALPMSLLVNELVKRPLGLAIERAGDASGGDVSLQTMLALFMLAPIFEEAVKALPALIPAVRRRAVDRGTAALIGFAIGLGFGLGEAAFIGWKIGLDASMNQYPWYAFTGYLGERLIVCLFHGVMTATFVVLLRRGLGMGVLGYLAAIAMHAYLNAPILLLNRGLVPEWVMSVHLPVALVLFAAFFAWLLGRKPAELTAERTPAIVYFRRDPYVAARAAARDADAPSSDADA